MSAKARSAVIYRGPSLIDGAPIVVVAVVKSDNQKTGNVVQTYILREDLDPREANRTGADRSICGDCKYRGIPGKGKALAAGRQCYVFIGQGPLVVWQALGRGKYPDALTAEARQAIGHDRMVRIGTYGDGAAVPKNVWSDLLSEAKGYTGYSHQAKNKRTSFDPALYMVSVSSISEAEVAWSKGHRTFRVISAVNEVQRKNEILCPASAEAGHKLTCDKCKLCAGNSIKAKSVAIVFHGAGARRQHLRRVSV